jgi:hypothetical protein
MGSARTILGCSAGSLANTLALILDEMAVAAPGRLRVLLGDG